MFTFHRKTQQMIPGSPNRRSWIGKEEVLSADADKVAVLLCDVWDNHWCRGAVERESAMIERMNSTVSVAREKGALIIHAPSDTMEFYANSPARIRAVEAPPASPPSEIPHDDPPLPVDASDGGCDTDDNAAGCNKRVWIRQHEGIYIDKEHDVISDDGREIYNVLVNNRIDHLIIMGVHTNMCVLGRSFAIKQMVRWGVDIMLCRDLTDSMYNPAKSPYVSHAEGTRLIIEYIEKFWCPTITSEDLLSIPHQA